MIPQSLKILQSGNEYKDARDYIGSRGKQTEPLPPQPTYKGRVYTITSPSGVSYSATWGFDRKPTQADLDRLVTKVREHHESISAEAPAKFEGSKATSAVRHQIVEPGFAPEQAARLGGAPGNLVADILGLVRDNAVSGAIEGAKSTVGDAAELDKVTSGALGKARANVGAAVGAIAQPFGYSPEQQFVRKAVGKAVEMNDPTQLISLAAQLEQSFGVKEGKSQPAGNVAKNVVNGFAKFLQNPAANAVKFLAGIDDATVAKAASGDEDAMAQVVGGFMSLASQTGLGHSAWKAIKGEGFTANAVSKALGAAEKAVTDAEALGKGLEGIRAEKPKLSGVAAFDLRDSNPSTASVRADMAAALRESKTPEGKARIKAEVAAEDARRMAAERGVTTDATATQDFQATVDDLKAQTTNAATPDNAGITTAHADIDKVREVAGWNQRESNPETIASWVEEAKQYQGKESAIADDIIGDGKDKKPRQATKVEEAALGVRLNQLLEERSKAQAAQDTVAFDLADAEAQKIADALDASGSEWGRQGVARQILLKNSYDDFSFKRRAAKANLDMPLNANEDRQASGFSARISALEKTMADIKAQMEQTLPQETKAKPKGTIQERRAYALGRLRKRGFTTSEVGQTTEGFVRPKGSKKAGAIPNISDMGADEQVRSAVRTVVRTYYEEGAAGLDDIVARLRSDLGGISEDDALALLSDKYKKVKLEADIAKREADRFLRSVKKAAVERQKPILVRVASAVGKELQGIQRSFQTAFDIGGTLIQGGKAAIENPKAVGLAFLDQLKVIPSVDTQAAFDKLMVGMMQDPVYARAKQAGIQFDDYGGSVDFFGHEGAVQKIPGIFKSEAAFKAYKNRLRLEMFRSFSRAAPDNAAHLKSSANLVNVMTGTAQGKAGEAARRFGGLFYAPSFEVSKWQYLIGQPLLDAASKNGINSPAFRQAAASYAKQAAAWTMLTAALEKIGVDVDLDPRSSDFGRATFQNGLQVDMFGKQYSPMKTIAQTFWARISKKGNVSFPDAYKDSPIESYVTGKMSPFPKTLYEAGRKGYTYDFDTEKDVPIDMAYLGKTLIPLGFSDATKAYGDVGWLAGAALVGVNFSKAKRPTPGKSPSVPLRFVPKGVQNRIEGNIPK